MGSIPDNELSETMATEYDLSERGTRGFLHDDVWGPREHSMGNPWAPNNPDGTIILRLAENSLMHKEIGGFIEQKINVRPIQHLTYSTGPRGSHRLRRALADFWTREFNPHVNIGVDNVFITPGLASALDGMAWALCNEGDGIMVPLPLYNGFNFDLSNRSKVKVVGISYEGIDGFSRLEDLFRPEVNRRAIESALRKAKEDNITIRALLISNPHNPLGRCYPADTLKEFAAVCGENKLHLISDEIYAKSVFNNPAIPDAIPFTSILSLDLDNFISPTATHVLYGASKDFCANGLRLGVIYTQNKGVMGAISSISIFSWSPHIIQDVWAAMFEDKRWLSNFMCKKLELMEANYNITTSFLRKHGISYLEMNAGLFIWIDLGRLLLKPSPPQKEDVDLLETASTDPEIYKQREITFTNICIKNGVMISPGHIYMAEQYGWFRVTFTLGGEALEEGLKRLAMSIEDIKLQHSGWGQELEC